MPSDDATVADVLQALPDEEEYRKLLAYHNDSVPASTLDYEDWVRPLKLTGGRVCLRVDWYDNEWFIHRCRAGILLGADADYGVEEAHTVPPSELCALINDPSVDLTPVLRENTPFAGAGTTDGGP